MMGAAAASNASNASNASDASNTFTLQAVNRTLLLGGQPFLARGVAYSPTPIGYQPSETQSLDFFTDEFAPIFERDLSLMAAAGVNAIRIYSLTTDEGSSHREFFNACEAHGISVMVGFELQAAHHRLNDDDGFLTVTTELKRQLLRLEDDGAMPRSLAMFFVGNELNLPSNGFICETNCQFDGTQFDFFAERIDDLCKIVVEHGLLCTSPLAEYDLPEAKRGPAGKATAWFEALEPLMSHVGVWAANVYGAEVHDDVARGGHRGPFGNWFDDYRARSTKPVLITEYGVDAFDSSGMREDAASQARQLQRLVEQLERNAVTCTFNCEDAPVASGGFVFAWVDEWWKGQGLLMNGPKDTEWYNPDQSEFGKCPDWDPERQTPCGLELKNGLDDFWNEEWFGLIAPSRACVDEDANATTTPLGRPDLLTPREGYYTLGTLWALGGCAVQSVPPARAAEGGYNATAYDDYPQCAEEMRSAREADCTGRACLGAAVRVPPNVTDCDLQQYVHEADPTLCPRPPSHFAVVAVADRAASEPLRVVSNEPAVELLRVAPPPECEAPLSASLRLLAAHECDRSRGARRLQVVPGTFVLLLDCVPWLMRGISYSPVPNGHDPSYSEPYGDYFTDQYEQLWGRDLDLFSRMGANTVRLYAWRQSKHHTAFLDEADRRGLVVVSVYEMGTAEDTPVRTVQERNLLRFRLQSRVRLSRHRAIVAWLVGNELNGFWNEFVCDDDYARLHLPHDHCVFGESGEQLCRLVDSLCEVVKSEGFMCSTPFAGTSPPKPYLYGEHAYGFLGWVQLCEGTKAYHPWEGVQHVDFWAANLYPGRDFGPLFESYAQVTNRSLMVSEFGVDAYDTNCRGPEYPEVIGCEDQASQAEWVLSLVEVTPTPTLALTRTLPRSLTLP